MTEASWDQRYAAALASTYNPPRRLLVRAAGTQIWDDQGREYTDFLSGIAVNVLGHCHPEVLAAVTQQMATLDHVSNFFASPPQIRLAEALCELATANVPGWPARVFFANSGAEANEAGFKLARLTGRPKIIAMQGSFHGRTMGSLAITHKAAYREPFAPLPGDIEFVPYGSVEALAGAVDQSVAAVVVEPVQGENGVVPAPAGFLAAAREITTQSGALLWVDEVQTGLGRCGEWLVSVADGVTPDVITLAKGLGNGYPIGACIALGPAAGLFTPGTHGTTFGGNPVAAAAGLAVLATIGRDDMLGQARRLGEALADAIMGLGNPLIAEVRGRGLLRGVVFTQPIATSVNDALLEAGWITNAPRPNVLRLAPPLIVTLEQLDSFALALDAVLHDVGRTLIDGGDV